MVDGPTTALVSFLTGPFFLLSVAFWGVAYLVARGLRNRPKTVTFLFPFLFMLRTRRLNEFLTRAGRRFKKFWKGLWTIGALTSFGLLFFGVYFFTANLVGLVVNPKIQNVVSPIIPGVTVDFVVFGYLLLPILVNVTIHEFAHAVATTAEGGKLESTGIFGVGLFFVVGYGAFVEPNERMIRSRSFKKRARARVAGAGTFVNLVSAGVCFLLLANFSVLLAPHYGPHVTRFTKVLTRAEGGYNEGVASRGDVLVAVGGVRLDLDGGVDLSAVLANQTTVKITPGQALQCTFWSRDGEYNKTLRAGPRPFVGISMEWVNDSAASVAAVYSTLQGGNNEGKVPVGVVFTGVNGTSLDRAANATLEALLWGVTPPATVVLNAANGSDYPLRVDYFPRQALAFEFPGFYLGFSRNFEEGRGVVVGEVFQRRDPNLPAATQQFELQPGDVVVAVNGTPVTDAPNSLERALLEVLNPRPGDLLEYELADGSVKRATVQTVPVVSAFVGVQSEDFWIPRNSLASFLGGTFPTQLLRQLLYFWMVAFSLALFNALPVPVFDGDLLTRELLNWTVGEKPAKRRRSGVKLVLNYDDPKYSFPDVDVERVVSVRAYQSTEPLVEGVDYEVLDENGNGHADALSFEPTISRAREKAEVNTKGSGVSGNGGKGSGMDEEVETNDSDGASGSSAAPEKAITTNRPVPEGSTLLVDYDYWEDELRKKKATILNAVRIFVTSVLLANFVLSFTKFGVVTFWI
ncbi:MAG: hypothetical protein Kow0069_01350 [Promethearchaeota archaeon]